MNIMESVRNWNSTRRTERALRGLSARQLDDIGVSRHGISAVARNPHLV